MFRLASQKVHECWFPFHLWVCFWSPCLLLSQTVQNRDTFFFWAFSSLVTFVPLSYMSWNSIISLFFLFSFSVSSEWFLWKVQCSELFSVLPNHFSHLALKVPGEKEESCTGRCRSFQLICHFLIPHNMAQKW